MDNTLIIYTDGACRGNQSTYNIGAWAYTLCYKGKKKECSLAVKNTTNNIMELTAILESLKAIKEAHRSVPVCVYSDSAYCINGITTWRHGWKKRGWLKSDNKTTVGNLELWQELDDLLGLFKDVTFIKVKGHSGEIGNERVDQLCNLRMDSVLNKI